MHVAHLLRKYNPAEWGGTETVIYHLCDGLRRDGVASTVFCPQISPNGAPDPLVDAGCAIRRFRACVPILGISDEQRRQMVAVGGNLLSFDLLRMLWSTRKLSLIHSHTLGRIGGAGLTIARRKKIPFVLTIHGGVYDVPDALHRSFGNPQISGWEWGKPFGLLFGSRRVLTDADAILTCNPREAQLVRERHPDLRVIVQPHGIRAEVYTVDRREAAMSAFPEIAGRKVILCLGRIDAVKNQGWVIEQLPALARRHPDVMVVLAGACTDEVYGAALRRRIDELGLTDRVLITGKLPPADPRLVGLLQVARVSVLPSISETFGLVILEAWAAGTPTVSSRTSGASALIEDGRNGWLFELNQPEQFLEAIEVPLTNSAARTQAVGAGRVRAAEYDTRVLATRVRQLYEELAEQRYAVRHST